MDMQFENNLILYFYSSMPQVLGTMLALIGGFIFFRIERYNRAIFLSTDKICQLIQNWKNENPLKTRSSYKQELSMQFNILTVAVRRNNVEKICSAAKGITSILLHRDKLTDKNKSEQRKKIAPKFENPIRFEANLILKSESLIKSANANIKYLLVFNGLIIFFFIMSFALLPISKCSIFWFKFFLYIGVVLASISIYTLITFIIYALREELQFSIFGNIIFLLVEKVLTYLKLK